MPAAVDKSQFRAHTLHQATTQSRVEPKSWYSPPPTSSPVGLMLSVSGPHSETRCFFKKKKQSLVYVIADRENSKRKVNTNALEDKKKK